MASRPRFCLDNLCPTTIKIPKSQVSRNPKNPIAFVAFWGICFVTVILVCFLAIYDMLIIRKEHQARVESFEDELAAAEAEARILATQEKAKMAAEEANGDS